MDAVSQSVYIELNYDNFTLDSSTVLQNNSTNTPFVMLEVVFCNLKDKEGFDRKSLLADICDNDVDAVVRLCPYFAVEGKRIGLKLLVRKTVLRKGFQTGGRISLYRQG